MREKVTRIAVHMLLVSLVALGGRSKLQAQTKTPSYATAAPLDQYLIANKSSEIALARSAAPPSVSNGAEVLVLARGGYVSAVRGGNGFVCLVERSWGAATDSPEFWNPKVRAPICVNPQAVKAYLPTVLLKARLVLAARSKAQIAQAVRSALDAKEVPALEPGAMCYMMSREQYLSDEDMRWHPHMMWFVPGDRTKDWGANLPGSPTIAANDPEDRMTIFLVWVSRWSDGAAAPDRMH